MNSLIDLADMTQDEPIEKARQALERYRLEEVTTLAGFELGYSTLEAQFGLTADLERREVLEAWCLKGSLSPLDAPIQTRYHLVLAKDMDGSVAGVRDCFVALDAASRRCVVRLAHTLVLPEHRRGGLAALLRLAPFTLARRSLARAGLAAESAEILLVGEMDMVTPEDRSTVVRLIAYGRAGFRVVPPVILPCAQPDLRDEASMNGHPQPMPYLLVVRQQKAANQPILSRATLEAIVYHLEAIHGAHCQPEHLLPLREHAFAALARFEGEDIPLLALPTDTSKVADLAPLLRSVTYSYYPRDWWGKSEVSDDPANELQALIAAWG